MSRTNPFLGLLCLTISLALAPGAIADTIPVTSAELRIEDEEVVLNAQFDVAFNPTLEEALHKGVSLYFVLEFELARPRWYWFDEKVSQQSVQYRVTYSPLTRQYRIASGLLGQQLNSLEEVEHQLSRVGSRPVAQLDQLTRGARYDAAVRLRLDVALLPKPFQINALASRDWTLQSDWYRWGFTP
jgi:Domain of unknown function (DUF4390)